MEREDKRVAQLWGGRFTKETDKLVYNFNASISFDQKFYKQDMEGSIAHVKMLGKQGILTEKEMQDIVDCLKEILKEVEEGKLIISDEYEDIHSFVEAKLIDRLGDTGKKLHTGRSRNDQVALDMRLYTRQEVLHTDKLVKELLETILKIMEENTETIMPGFTHLQKAQPITLAHHISNVHDNGYPHGYLAVADGAEDGRARVVQRQKRVRDCRDGKVDHGCLEHIVRNAAKEQPQHGPAQQQAERHDSRTQDRA